MSKRKQVDDGNKKDFDDYITNDSSYNEKRPKKMKPLTLQQRKDRVISFRPILKVIAYYGYLY